MEPDLLDPPGPPRAHQRRDVVVLGSTGSVGTQALELVRRSPGRFRVVGIGAGGGDVATLAAQALEHRVAVVAVARATAAQDLQLALYADAQRRGYDRGEVRLPKILAGPSAMAELAAWPCDTVLNAVTGSVGLAPTLAALDAGRTLALANKESLVVGGRLVTERARPGQIVPVDSEHSALAQCLRGGRADEVRRLVLTASGGPFRGRTVDEMRRVTYAEARAHPTWDMGPVITINSATLMNKGLELIEAHLLFGVPYQRIDVVVHPQSMIHSMVEFVDGSTLAQASPPDMVLPISLALGWPDRVPDAAQACDWTRASSWTFEPLDHAAFPAFELCRSAGLLGGTAPAVLNAANEEAVDAFAAGGLPFLGIVDTVAKVLGEHLRDPRPDALRDESGTKREKPDASSWNTPTLADVLAAEQWARGRARQLVGRARDGDAPGSRGEAPA